MSETFFSQEAQGNHTSDHLLLDIQVFLFLSPHSGGCPGVKLGEDSPHGGDGGVGWGAREASRPRRVLVPLTHFVH